MYRYHKTKYTYLEVAVGGADGEDGAVDGGVLRDGGRVGGGDELRGKLIPRHQHRDVSGGRAGRSSAVHCQHLELRGEGHSLSEISA